MSMPHDAPTASGHATLGSCLKTALALATLGLVSGAAVAPATGQARDVAYVEAVKGSITATAADGPQVLDVLDIIDDQTRLELPARSELRLCHHEARKIVVLKGPLRATVSTAAITADSGKAVAPSADSCIAPVISTFQGGIVSRSVGGAIKVPLTPSIKVVGAKDVRKLVLWDSGGRRMLASYQRGVARPRLEDGRAYVIVVERERAPELRMTLEASAAIKPGPVILLAR
jgi:hypothetical protein